MVQSVAARARTIPHGIAMLRTAEHGAAESGRHLATLKLADRPAPNDIGSVISKV
jgi:hypothetical protein